MSKHVNDIWGGGDTHIYNHFSPMTGESSNCIVVWGHQTGKSHGVVLQTEVSFSCLGELLFWQEIQTQPISRVRRHAEDKMTTKACVSRDITSPAYHHITATVWYFLWWSSETVVTRFHIDSNFTGKPDLQHHCSCEQYNLNGIWEISATGLNQPTNCFVVQLVSVLR